MSRDSSCLDSYFRFSFNKVIPERMVQLTCGIRFTRIVFIIFNVIFLIFGLVLFGFGIYLAASKKFDVAFFEDVKADILGGKAIENIGIIVIVVGLLTVVLSIVGGIGMYSELVEYYRTRIFS